MANTFNGRLLVSLILVVLAFVANLAAQESQTEKLDLEEWVKPNSIWGRTSYKDGELFARSIRKGYYYVLAATEDKVSVGNTVSVSLRNVNGAATPLGYGIVFHSNPTPLVKGYAFVIDSLRRRYRVMRHVPKDELTIVKWKPSTAINAGLESNVLTAKDIGDSTELYVNGTLVETISNEHAFPNGVVGLYAPAITIAFKDLTIRHQQMSGSFGDMSDTDGPIAKGTFDVKTTPQPADDAAAGPFGRLFLDKKFHGDLDAVSKGQMMGAQTETEGSGAYVALEQVTGTLAGKKGSFMLMHNGTMQKGGNFVLNVSVVPDSGTGDLKGISGTMKIIIEDKKHLYEFSYSLPK
ncbi:MAG TPA: DUF3224 domain-containing protein [Pyrinomonadaceae bacterium]|nr:DUF3224 domain-containing protein [Pyrinomonadaceae bacterium]